MGWQKKDVLNERIQQMYDYHQYFGICYNKVIEMQFENSETVMVKALLLIHTSNTNTMLMNMYGGLCGRAMALHGMA